MTRDTKYQSLELDLRDLNSTCLLTMPPNACGLLPRRYVMSYQDTHDNTTYSKVAWTEPGIDRALLKMSQEFQLGHPPEAKNVMTY